MHSPIGRFIYRACPDAGVVLPTFSAVNVCMGRMRGISAVEVEVSLPRTLRTTVGEQEESLCRCRNLYLIAHNVYYVKLDA
jgi:hypothetical protein